MKSCFLFRSTGLQAFFWFTGNEQEFPQPEKVGSVNEDDVTECEGWRGGGGEW